MLKCLNYFLVLLIFIITKLKKNNLFFYFNIKNLWYKYICIYEVLIPPNI